MRGRATHPPAVPVPGSEEVYRWHREAHDLRMELLLPLLDEAAPSTIESAEAAIYAGAATAETFEDVDRLLGRAHAVPTPEVLDALRAREATLIDYARGHAGAVSDVAVVLRLGILARRREVPADDYARAFVTVVNRFIPIAGQTAVGAPLDL